MYDETKTHIADRRELLRVLIKTNTGEARLLRKEENRTFGKLSGEFMKRRVCSLRHHSRLLHIAYGLLRGRSIQEIETKVNEKNKLTSADWSQIHTLLRSYGTVGGTKIADRPTDARAARQERGRRKAEANAKERASLRKFLDKSPYHPDKSVNTDVWYSKEGF